MEFNTDYQLAEPRHIHIWRVSRIDFDINTYKTKIYITFMVELEVLHKHWSSGYAAELTFPNG